jgi:hypothetical protein
MNDKTRDPLIQIIKLCHLIHFSKNIVFELLIKIRKQTINLFKFNYYFLNEYLLSMIRNIFRNIFHYKSHKKINDF